VSFSLTILGSSSALPTSQRFTSAHALTMHGHSYLIDCGEGSQIRLRQLGISLRRINHIFISHLHGDHYYGLYGLITSLNLLGRKNDLNIYAFPELYQLLNLDRDIFPHEKLDYNINIIPLNNESPQIIYENKNIEVLSIPLRHRIPCCGFVFAEKEKPRKMLKEAILKYNIPIACIKGIKDGNDYICNDGRLISNNLLIESAPPQKKYAYINDTLYTKSVIPYVKYANILYHEATFDEKMIARARQTCHSTAKQAAIIAKESEVEKLIIGHFSARYKELQPLLNEAREIFPETYLAEDGLNFNF